MTIDEMERAIIDLTKRVQAMEMNEQRKASTVVEVKPSVQPRYHTLGAFIKDDDLGPYAPMDDDCA